MRTLERLIPAVVVIINLLTITGIVLFAVAMYQEVTANKEERQAPQLGQAATGDLSVRLPQGLRRYARDTVEPTHTEMGWCLYGRFEKNIYYIEGLTIPENLERKLKSVEMVCDRTRRFLGYMHSHPHPDAAYLSGHDAMRLDFPNEVISAIYMPFPPHRIHFFHTRDKQCFDTVYIMPSRAEGDCKGTKPTR